MSGFENRPFSQAKLDIQPFTLSCFFAIIFLMTKKIELAEEINSRYGTIKRCRKCFLYTAKGVRLTDLYQEAGAAILGWGGSVFTVLKNVLDRGVTGSYYSDFSNPNGKERSRLSKALTDFFGDARVAFVFSSKQEAVRAALSVSSQSTSVYRPWNPESLDWQGVDCIVLRPAFPWAGDIHLLAVKAGLAPKHFPAEIFLPAPLCAAVTRSLYDLIKAIQEREEKHWFIYDQIISRYWLRKGPYLYPKVPEERYADFVIHCLENKLVISPDYSQPSIIPFGADKGNFSLLKNNPFEYE